MALSQRDLAQIKELLVGASGSSAPAEVKCDCKCECKCITEAQLQAAIKPLDDKLNALYSELQSIKSALS